jgi:hypothetical protein
MSTFEEFNQLRDLAIADGKLIEALFVALERTIGLADPTLASLRERSRQLSKQLEARKTIDELPGDLNDE